MTVKSPFSMQLRPIRVYTRQFGYSLTVLPRSLAFIREQKLWRGALSYGWLTRVFFVLALLGGVKFLSLFLSWSRQLFDAPDAVTVVSSMGLFAKDLAVGSYDLLFSSGTKYLMLILLEVVVFHFSRRTMALLTGKEANAGWNEFLEAQIRMVKVAFRSWILELIVVALLGIALSIVSPLAFLKPALVLTVQAYFLGFAIVDNFNEQFGLTIKESIAYAWQYLGVVMAVGLFFYVMLTIPLVGTIAGPCIAAVAVCMIMHKLSDLHTMKEKPAVDLEEMV